MVTGAEFKNVVYAYWANRFRLPIEEFSREGGSIYVDDELSGLGSLNIYHVGRLNVIRISPEVAERVGLENGMRTETGLDSPDAILSHFAGVFDIALESTLLDYFLDPADFSPCPVPEEFTVQRVEPETDADLLSALFDACTEDELDEADIILGEPDPVIFGLFREKSMAAYASHRYWGDKKIADIGVLIHPEFRGRGLGKAIVSELCEWCIANDVVPMYRVFEDHPISRRIPVTLGFRELVPIRTMTLRASGRSPEGATRSD